MPKLSIGLAAIAATIFTATTASAQYAATRDTYAEEAEYEESAGVAGPVTFNIGAPLSLPVSDSGSRLDPGLGFAAGVGFRPPRSPVGIQAEYMFTYYDVEGDIFDATSLDGRQIMHNGNLNIIVRPPKQRQFGFYLIGGGGIYNRNVEVSEFEGVGLAPYCDPYLFFCYAQPVAVDQVIGSQDSTDFGVNGGLGVFAVLTPPMRLYLEARYHYIWGPEFEREGGDRVDSDGEFVPVVLGLAF